MSVSIGIVGLPNTGKSTLFNALTKKGVPAENFPFCTIDPSVGVVAVPDGRLEKLSAISKSKKILPAAIEFVDIAGLVKGAAEGEGLGNAFLSHIREVDAILHMVRAFKNKDILHVDGEPSPLRDIETINTELILSDLQGVEKRLQKIESDVKKGNKDAIFEKEVLSKVHTLLQEGKVLAHESLDEKEVALLKQLGLLTIKPVLYCANISTGTGLEMVQEVQDYAKKTGMQSVVVDVRNEQEIQDMGDEGKNLKVELGIEGDGVDMLIVQAYKLLNLMTYFTTGEEETRAWTIPVGSTAPRAGRAIHTDFEQRFIRAEVVAYADLIDAGTYAEARTKGKVRTEGKEYIVQDGDVIIFKV